MDSLRARPHSRTFRLIVIGFVFLLVAGLIAAGIWLANPAQPMAEAETSLTSDSIVKVRQAEWIVFEPRASRTKTGLILYPGGRVLPRAYAPTARALAEEGYLVVIVPMPLNLAVLAPGAAQDVIEQFDQIEHWAIGGHSLGGSMAARFVHANPLAANGLVLWASYPAQSDDLSDFDLKVTSIYASNDGLASVEEVLASADRLPASATFVSIDGGNHAQFGWYGPQSGDGQATISRPTQQQRIIEATADLLRSISAAGDSQLGQSYCELDRIVEVISMTSATKTKNVR